MPVTRRHPYNESMKPIAQKIERSEEKRGKSPEEAKRIAYATLNRMGAKRGSITTKRGAAMLAEHRVGARGQVRKFERGVEKRARKRFGHAPRKAIRRRYPTRSERYRRR